MKNSVGISLQLWKKTCRCVEIQNRTCLVHEFKHDCATVLSTISIKNHASTYAKNKKKRLSKMNNKNMCWLTLSFTCSCIIFLLQSTCCRQVGMCINWWIFAMPYSFSCIFSSYLTLAHHSIYIFMLTTSPCWWIFLNVFINELLLATATSKQCSTILLLTWTNMLPTWHFLYY